MKLYVTYTSPYARLARIVDLEKDLRNRVEIVEAKTRTPNSPYYQINPSGRVPYLIDDVITAKGRQGSVYNASKLLAASALFAALPYIGDALAADHKVWMKGSGAQPIQFEPAFLKIAAGDTVTFVPEDAGHNVESIAGMSPEGTEPWASSLDRELTVTFSAEGPHGYKCPPHLEMGMVGLIQVGNAVTDLDLDLANVDLPNKAKSRMKALLAKAGVAGSN